MCSRPVLILRLVGTLSGRNAPIIPVCTYCDEIPQGQNTCHLQPLLEEYNLSRLKTGKTPECKTYPIDWDKPCDKKKSPVVAAVGAPHLSTNLPESG